MSPRKTYLLAYEKTVDKKVQIVNGNNLQLIDLKTASEISGLSIWTWYQLCSQRRVNSYKLGRRRLISLKDLEEFIQSGRQEATTQKKSD